MWFIEYVFYVLYMFYSKHENFAKSSSIIVTAALLCFNFLSVLTIIDRVFQLKITSVIFTGDKNFDRFVTWPLTLAPFWIATHLYMSKSNKYLAVIERYKSETASAMRKGKIKVVIYFIGSLLLLVLLRP
jgi:hypothetical protein